MDEIPLPDDIPIPEDSQISTDISFPSEPPSECPENIMLDNIKNTKSEADADLGNTDGVSDTVADMDIQESTPDENAEMLESPAENPCQILNSETDAGDQYTFSEEHETVASQGDVPMPGESEHESSTGTVKENPTVEVSVSEDAVPNPDYSLQTSEICSTKSLDSQGDQTTVVDQMLQNSQMQYSTANYMYPQHMGDPSMMSNYSYMTGSYGDYMSMYNPMHQQYGNTYASYQNYNYAYPTMQQMYDGRNMTSYVGNYATQMISATPPLPSGQPVGHQMNNFNPPLPNEFSVTTFQSKIPTPSKNVDNQQQLQVKSNEAEKNENKNSALPLADKPEIDDDSTDVEKADSAELLVDETNSELEQTIEEETKALETSHISEDINRYSPSLPMDEDESNNQTADTESTSQILPPLKPSSVLGKAQAKKRLMAFSFSKQAAAAKKQAQETSASTTIAKNKKENGEVSSDAGNYNLESTNAANVFEDKHIKKKQKKVVQKEKARETMEEIEELKRTEMMIGTSALLYRQSLLSDTNNSSQLQDTKRSASRRRSRSNSYNRGRRRSRSRDRKSKRHPRKYRNRSRSKTRSQSKSRSRSSSVQDKKPTVKTSDIKSWDDFKISGFRLDRYRRIKFKENGNFLESEVERRKKEEMKHRYRRSRSNERRSTSIEKEVVEECRGRKINFLELPMEIKQPLLAVRDTARDSAQTRTSYDNTQEETLEYPSHILQYTYTKPTLKYCENPKHATLHFITRAQLLETVPDDISILMNRFWSTIRPKKLKQNHNKESSGDGDSAVNSLIPNKSHSTQWWPKSPLNENFQTPEDEVEDDDEDPISCYLTSVPRETASIDEAPIKPTERTRTRKSRFEEPTDNNQGVSIVVRSRWDSDYEDESHEKSLSNKTSKFDEPHHNFKNETMSKLNNETHARIYEESIDSQQKETEAENNDEKFIKTHDSDDKYSKKHREKKKRDEKNADSKKSKTKSPEVEMKIPNEEIYSQKTNVFDSVPIESGDHKLVSEYEEFLKMVNFEAPKEKDEMPLYEGPKPPPRWSKKVSEDVDKNKNSSVAEDSLQSENRNPFIGSDDEKEKLEVDEENFDIDTFFLKEKKMRKLHARNATETQSSVVEKEPQENRTDTEAIVESDKSEKKRDKKERSKKKKKATASLKTKKRSVKDKKKRKIEKKKKRKMSSDSSSDSSDTESENSDSKHESDSDSTSLSSNSSSTSSSSASSNDSSDSTSKKKRKRTKKIKKKDRKPEKSYSDKHKKKKRRKTKDSDSEEKKKKSKGDDGKKGKSKKLRSGDFFELIEKSLAVTLKKSENEGSPVKKGTKEKHKKKKKKHEKDKKEKAKGLFMLNLIASDLPEDVKTNLIEDENTQNRESSVESSSNSKKKKKSRKKKVSTESSNEESNTSSWKRRKIDPSELEENMTKAQINSFLEDSMAEFEKTSTDANLSEIKNKKKHIKESADISNDEEASWTKKKIDPKEIEESVAKAQLNSFFEENLDDWDKSSTAASVVNSMRDESKNEKSDDSRMKKKKKKHKDEKEKNEKLKYDKSKNDKEKNKSKNSHKKKKSKKRKKYDEKGKDKDNDLKNFMDIENIPLPDSDMSIVPPENENLNKVSQDVPSPKEVKIIKSDSSKQDIFNENEPVFSENTQNLFPNSVDSLKQTTVNVSDRYSPTACDAEDEELLSQKLKSPEKSPVSSNESKFPVCSNNVISSLYSHYLSGPQSSSTSIVPSPVPAPSPVPPPKSLPTSFSLADKLPSKTIETPIVSEDSAKASDKLAEANLGCKSFSIGKKEFRTKAALKFFSNNVFDSLDDLEKAEIDAETERQISENLATETDPNIPKETDHKEVETRSSPEHTGTISDDRKEKSPSRDRDKVQDENKRGRSTDRYRSSSRDRSRRKHRYDRDDSYDNYRRRSRSRDRYKKYSYRDRYRRRSRSRNRRRSRERGDYHRYKHRSYSSDREEDRRRTPPYDKNNKKGKDVASIEQHDFDYENTKREKDESRYDEERRNNMHVISEITKSVREISGNATVKGSNPDINALQENLVQLKETLQNLNKQGVPLDALHNVLSVLENSNISSKDILLHKSLTESADENREGGANFQKIMSVCHAIHSNLPGTPISEKKLESYSDVSPHDPSLKTKKSLADSTNGGFNKSRNRFDTRSREISPKPLSLDERLELELGVKRNVVPPEVPPQSAPINVNPAAYYPVPVFDGRTNFPSPLPIPNYPPPMINCNPKQNYYRPQRPALNWNNITKIPPPMMMPQIPPPCVVPQKPPEPTVQKTQPPYRVPDLAGNKVHSIQVGNVLQIVPTELQPSASSQSKIPSSQVPVVSSSPLIPNSQALNTLPNSSASGATGFSTLLSAHLPSFATAPAVSGAKTNIPSIRPNNETPVKEQKLVPNDPRQKSKELAPPPPSTPGITDIEMKKLMRLAKEKRKEEKVLQNILKSKKIRGSPATPTSDDSSLLEDTSMDEHGEHISTVHIKPSPEQGILISPGFKEKSTPVTALGRSIIGSTRKMVSFVDGVRPGSANDSPPVRSRRPSPPPSSPSSAPKKKHKVRVKIIRPDDSDDDDDAPPPPPPGPPPPELYPPSLGGLGVLPPGYILPKL